MTMLHGVMNFDACEMSEYKKIIFILTLSHSYADKTLQQVEHLVTWGLFYEHRLTLIPAWISKHTPSKIWDGITYPFLNFNGGTVEV